MNPSLKYFGRLCLLILSVCGIQWGQAATPPADPNRPVYIIPIRDDIEHSLVFVIRRGVREATAAKAQTIILDMDTNGGFVSETEKIMQILSGFPGTTITFINNKAFSAGAFISVSTQHIYMSPTGVIGAAAPIMASPEGGAQELPGVLQKKMSSGLSALMRAAAQKNGHNGDLVDAMVKETEGLTIDGKEIVKKGDILTLTVNEATALYGTPPKPLLAEGVVQNMDELLKKFGYAHSQVRIIKPTGAERLARLITKLSTVLLVIGIAGIYLEFKTPGMSIFGIVGAISLFIFFFGHHVAGLSGYEELILFLIGGCLILVEIFILPGTVIPGLLGVALILGSLFWAMVDKSPGPFSLPTFPQIQLPLANMAVAIVGSAGLALLLGRLLPKGKNRMGGLVLRTELDKASGCVTASSHKELVGREGVTASLLRPSGVARIGDRLVDVITEGEFLAANEKVRVREVRGAQVIVQKVTGEET